MAWYNKRNIDTTDSIPLNRLATPSQISSYIKRLIKASQYEYHESEALEVKEVILNKPGDRDSIRGVFLNSGEDPGVVKALMPNITAVPVVGEHVVCAEYNGQYYYTSVINRNDSINENAIPGVAGGYDKTKKYGKTFKREKVKPLRVGEGCVLFEGRFGQSIHLDGHQNKPTIKISTHVDTSDGNFRNESIDEDDSSIYITSDGLRGQMFNGQEVKNNSVLIRSDDIFISGRDEVRINALHVKLGSKDADESVIKGEELVKFLNDMLTDINIAFSKAMTAITPGGVVVTGGGAAIPIFGTDIALLQAKLVTESVKFKSKTVKTA